MWAEEAIHFEGLTNELKPCTFKTPALQHTTMHDDALPYICCVLHQILGLHCGALAAHSNTFVALTQHAVTCMH